jgi:hypothetical protein
MHSVVLQGEDSFKVSHALLLLFIVVNNVEVFLRQHRDVTLMVIARLRYTEAAADLVVVS